MHHSTLATARIARGWDTPEAFAEAVRDHAARLGATVEVTPDDVRAWEDSRLPKADQAAAVEALLGRPLTELGFPDRAQRTPREWEVPGEAGWEHTPADEGGAAPLERRIVVERAANTCWIYSAGMVPGLLQTYAYACAAVRMCCPGAGEDEVIRRVALRMQRRRAMEAHPHVHVVMDESALTNPVGGQGALCEQLGDLLVSLSRRPGLSVRILPSGSGAHPGLLGMFSLYDLGTRRMVSCEGLTGDSWTTRAADLQAYTVAYGHLQGDALGASASSERIAQALREMEMQCPLAAPHRPSGVPAATPGEATAWKSRPWEP